jgi:hypothetical protein
VPNRLAARLAASAISGVSSAVRGPGPPSAGRDQRAQGDLPGRPTGELEAQVEPLADERGQDHQAGIDDETEHAERDQPQRQRQELHDGPEQAVDEAEDEGDDRQLDQVALWPE